MMLAGSLAAVLTLAGAARLLGLGGNPSIDSEADAIRLAQEHDFAAVSASVESEHRAMVRDSAGRAMLLRRHGARFVLREANSAPFALSLSKGRSSSAEPIRQNDPSTGSGRTEWGE